MLLFVSMHPVTSSVCPDICIKYGILGIVRSVLTAIDEDDQNQGTAIDDEDDEVEQYEGYEDVQKMEVNSCCIY